MPAVEKVGIPAPLTPLISSSVEGIQHLGLEAPAPEVLIAKHKSTRRGKAMALLNSRIRQVRLRPQFASIYPGLDPGVWESATELAARLLSQHAVQPSPGFMLSNRILPEEHFEFQGGSPRGSFSRGTRSRVTD